MSSLADRSRLAVCALLGTLLLAAGAAVAADYAGIGRPATPKEVAAWDIDVRPDFKGLPSGSGSVQKGQGIWDGRCASCHGSFGESNEVFTPIIGGTTKEDMKTGHVAALTNNTQPQRTTMMKLSTVSTLWDYIHRAMPWNAPKTLSTDDVYAVTAYILNMAEVVPDDFVLSDKNIAQVQARLPNRNGMTTAHGLWDVKGKPDTRNVACMKDCTGETTITARLPASMLDSHGNLADQNRPFGPVRGIAAGKAAASSSRPADGKPGGKTDGKTAGADGKSLAEQRGCLACHGISAKIVGPGFKDVAAKYKDDAGAQARLLAKLREGGSGAWGQVPMPPQASVPETELKSLLQWVLAGAN